jgi:hypothetical protein
MAMTSLFFSLSDTCRANPLFLAGAYHIPEPLQDVKKWIEAAELAGAATRSW